MNKSMSHAGPPFEINLWVLCARLIRDIVCRFAKNLHVVNYQLCTVIALGKHCSFQPIQLRSYAPGSTHHVLQSSFITIISAASPHIATASLHTLFAKRGALGNTDEETTSTPRPSSEEKPLSIES